MTLSELQAQMPELKEDIRVYLDKRVIFYKVPLVGEPTIDDAKAAKIIKN